MRKSILLLAVFLAVGAFAPSAARSAPPEETKLVVERWSADPSPAQAGAACALTLRVLNTHPKKDAFNLTVSIVPGQAFASGDALTRYFDRIPAGQSAEAPFELRTLPGVLPGACGVEVVLRYEDSRGFPVEARETLALEVAQPLRLGTDEPSVAPVGASEPAVIKITVRNLGKDRMFNVTAAAWGEGMDPLGDAYTGNLDSGESLVVAVTLRLADSVAEAVKHAAPMWDAVKLGDPDPVLLFPAELELTCEDAAGTVTARRFAVSLPVLIPRPEEPAYDMPSGAEGAAPPPDIAGWAVAGLAAALAAAVLAAVWAARRRNASR